MQTNEVIHANSVTLCQIKGNLIKTKQKRYPMEIKSHERAFLWYHVFFQDDTFFSILYPVPFLKFSQIHVPVVVHVITAWILAILCMASKLIYLFSFDSQATCTVYD
jgi:hypothetical protein